MAEGGVAGEGGCGDDLADGEFGEDEEFAGRVDADLVADRLERGALGGE